MKNIIHTIFCFVISLLITQPYQLLMAQHGCHSGTIHQHLMDTDASYAERFNAENIAIAENTAKYANQQLAKSGGSEDIVTIPVVFHIMHRSEHSPGEETNLSDQQIHNAMQWLNEGFRNQSLYSPANGVDTEFEFCLATKDEFGNATTGINRYADSDYTLLDYATEDDAMKASTGWDYTQYLNVWITELIGNSLLGVGNITGYSSGGWHNTTKDGVVVRYDFMGNNYINNNVFIHEVGHYLNLVHTFENGCTNAHCLLNGDYVCDTPPDGTSASIGCNAINSCSTDEQDTESRNPFRSPDLGGLGNQNDMLENYMDYSDLACQNRFTQGQKTRMRLSFFTVRSAMLESPACETVFSRDVGITRLVSPHNFLNDNVLIVTLKNFGSNTLTSATINCNLSNGATYDMLWTGSLAQNEEVDVLISNSFLLDMGSYTINASASNPNGLSDQNNGNNEISHAFVKINEQPIPFTSNFENETITNQQWVSQNLDNDIGWETINIAGTCPSNGNNAMYVNNQSYGFVGATDILYTAFDLTFYTNVTLSFDVSYAPPPGTNKDLLEVLISTDGGLSFSTVYYSKDLGNDFYTGDTSSDPWYPSACTDWRTETISLQNFTTNKIIVAIANHNMVGNTMYIDNVSLDGTEEILCFPPTNLTVNGAGFVSANLSWNETETDATYIVRYRPVGTIGWQNEIFFYPDNNITINGLFIDTEYEVWVQSACANGFTSIPISTTFITDFISCSPPQNLFFTEINKNNVSLSWDGPAEANGYIIYYKPEFFSEGAPPLETAVFGSSEVTLTDLIVDLTYEIEIFSICDGGLTSPAGTTAFVTTQASCNPPDGIIIDEVAPNCVKVIWEAEDDAITYKVQHRKLGTSSYSNSFVSNLSVVLNNLDPLSLYELRIQCTCEGSTSSEYSYDLVFSTDAACTAPQVSNVAIIDDNTANISWPASTEGVSEYTLRYRTVGTSSWNEFSTSSTSYILNGLIPCTTYEIQLQSACSNSSANLCEATSAFSSSFTFNSNCNDYCPIALLPFTFYWINHINIDGFTHFSNTSNGYDAYLSSPIFELIQGFTHNIVLTEASNRKEENTYWYVYLDTNQNFNFETEELILQATNLSPNPIYSQTPLSVAQKLSIPTGTTIGNTRMRIVVSTNDTYNNPCTSPTNGDVIDYLVNIVEDGGKTESTKDVMVYPNPADQFVYIVDEQINSSAVKVNWFTANGQLIDSQQYVASNNTLMINTANFKTGIYWVQINVTNTNYTKTTKIVVSH